MFSLLCILLTFVTTFFLLTTNAQILNNNNNNTTLSMQCNITVNGKYYDLTPLHARGDIKVTPSNSTYDYYINVCGAVQGPCSNHTSAFACQVKKSTDEFQAVMAYSDWENHQPPPMWGHQQNSTDLLLKFTNGDSCASATSRERTTIFDFQCDETGTRNITIEENPQCTFTIIFPTKVVCQDVPTTAAPTTVAPTTHAPNATTAVPTTEAPTHTPNATTAVPTTEAPTTAPNTTTAIPTTAAPTYLPTTAAPTTPAPTSTPSSASSTVDDATITRAGLGAGIGIGIGCLAVVWLLWCCYDRRRVQQQQQRPSASTYGSV